MTGWAGGGGGGGGGGTGRNYRGLAIRKGALGPAMLRTFLYFSVVLFVVCTHYPSQTKHKSLYD